MGQRYHQYARYSSADRVLSIRMVRDNIADVVDLARQDEPTVVTRRGREIAAVVPTGMLFQWRRWEEEKLISLFEARGASATVPLATVLIQVLGRSR